MTLVLNFKNFRQRKKKTFNKSNLLKISQNYTGVRPVLDANFPIKVTQKATRTTGIYSSSKSRRYVQKSLRYAVPLAPAWTNTFFNRRPYYSICSQNLTNLFFIFSATSSKDRVLTNSDSKLLSLTSLGQPYTQYSSLGVILSLLSLVVPPHPNRISTLVPLSTIVTSAVSFGSSAISPFSFLDKNYPFFENPIISNAQFDRDLQSLSYKVTRLLHPALFCNNLIVFQGLTKSFTFSHPNNQTLRFDLPSISASSLATLEKHNWTRQSNVSKSRHHMQTSLFKQFFVPDSIIFTNQFGWKLPSFNELSQEIGLYASCLYSLPSSWSVFVNYPTSQTHLNLRAQFAGATLGAYDCTLRKNFPQLKSQNNQTPLNQYLKTYKKILKQKVYLFYKSRRYVYSLFGRTTSKGRRKFLPWHASKQIPFLTNSILSQTRNRRSKFTSFFTRNRKKNYRRKFSRRKNFLLSSKRLFKKKELFRKRFFFDKGFMFSWLLNSIYLKKKVRYVFRGLRYLGRRKRNKLLSRKPLNYYQFKLKRQFLRINRTNFSSVERILTKNTKNNQVGPKVRTLSRYYGIETCDESLMIVTLRQLISSLISRVPPTTKRLTILKSNFQDVSGSTAGTDINKEIRFGNGLNSQKASTFSLPSFSLVWHSPLAVKYILIKFILSKNNLFTMNIDWLASFIRRLQSQHLIYFSNAEILSRSNLWSFEYLNYTLTRRLIRYVQDNTFNPKVTSLYYKVLISFIENLLGRRVSLNFGPFLEAALTFEDRSICTMWSGRVQGFQKILGHRIFVVEAVELVALSLRLKDPNFLASWIRTMLQRMSFWKYRLLFRYIKFLVRHLFKPYFTHFNFKGFKLRLRGKISVAGNARTRSLRLRVGNTSHSKMNNRVAYDLSFVNTFTGVLGFKLWFFY